MQNVVSHMLTFHQDDDRQRIDAVASGQLTLAEGMDFVKRQLLGGAWHYKVLFDMRDVQQSMSEAEAAEMVQYIKVASVGLRPRGPLAVLVAKPELRSLADGYSVLGKEARLRVATFEDAAAAEKWLAAFTT